MFAKRVSTAVGGQAGAHHVELTTDLRPRDVVEQVARAGSSTHLPRPGEPLARLLSGALYEISPSDPAVEFLARGPGPAPSQRP
jgi:hypothetical protein